ncbi:MAG TPA: transglycosylase SLT domain-containing protein [Candidatus Binataceae bacterium]
MRLNLQLAAAAVFIVGALFAAMQAAAQLNSTPLSATPAAQASSSGAPAIGAPIVAALGAPTPGAGAPSYLAPVAGAPPSDAAQAFADGYRAYSSHDLARAAERLQFASANSTTLADYALYYLGLAQRDQGDLNGAAGTFDRLLKSYPQSVMADAAELELARAQFNLGRYAEASASAARLAARSENPELEQSARLVEAKALVALGDFRGAYTQVMAIRDQYPRGASDAEARSLAHSILVASPTVADSNSLAYHKSEADLLLREGESAGALAQARAAFAMSPPQAERAELLWLEARALHSDPQRATRAILDYLNIAPAGPSAPAALEALALIYWHDNDYARARATLNRIVSSFPHSTLAPAAMLRIGRIFEEEHKLDSARSEYRKLIARFPASEAADEARFRAPWASYLTGQYSNAAAGFQAARAHTKEGSERDMFGYWRARALEKSGDRATAHAIYTQVAASIESNYYPLLASRRIEAPPPELPAASMPDPVFGSPPAVSPTAEFHVERALELRALGLKQLEPAELQMLEAHTASNPRLREFVFAALVDAQAWYAAIQMVTRMEKRGEIGRETAERVRYPRAYWDPIRNAAAQRGLDPYLVLALARQESLFNPEANSSSDARGLMQLLPSTARRVAAQRGMAMESLNLYDPALNLELGTTYLKILLEMFGGDQFRAVAAYNAGEHAVAHWVAIFPMEDDEWVENIGYRETREYVKKVLGGRREYLLLYGRTSAAT